MLPWMFILSVDTRLLLEDLRFSQVLINIQFLCDTTLCQLIHRTVLPKPAAPCFRVCVVKEQLLPQKWVYYICYRKCGNEIRGRHFTKINHIRKILCKKNLDAYNKSQQDAWFLKFILIYNSKYFRQTYCPSSGVLNTVLRLPMVDSKPIQNIQSCISK